MNFVVIDDDPTGSQTVHDCLLLLKWDCSTLAKGFESKSNLFFILANTRSLSENDAKLTIEEICKNLNTVITSQAYEEEIIFISRGDSTLRGHNFLEPVALNSYLGPFDATFHIPAFIEGKRLTINGLHFVDETPISQTIFASDKSAKVDYDWLDQKVVDGFGNFANYMSLKMKKLQGGVVQSYILGGLVTVIVIVLIIQQI